MADLGRMTQFWFSKAEDDPRVARALLDFESKHFEAAVFHCQQAKEIFDNFKSIIPMKL